MLQSTDSASLASTPAPHGSVCPACGTENSATSRFCRQCGSSLTAAASAAATMPAAVAADGMVLPLTAPISVSAAGKGVNPEEDGGMDTHGHSVSEEIDARRAKQLMDRALHLGERNEIQAAILACRQAIALCPSVASGYSMLGMLLERANDPRGAIKAYERVLHLAPNSALERDSLARLYDRIEQNPAAFPPASPLSVIPDLPQPKVASAAASAAVSAEASVVPSNNAQVQERRDQDRRQVSVPVAVERRRKQDRRVEAAATATVTAAAVAAPAPVLPISTRPAPVVPAPAPSRLLQSPLMMQDLADRPPSPWQTVTRNPSFYWRGMPLVATVVLSLGFLTWARGYAVSKTPAVLVETPPVEQSTTQVLENPTTATTDSVNQTTQAPRPVNPNGQLEFSNRPIPTPGQPASATTTTTSAAQPATARTQNARPATGARPAPPLQPLPPAPIPAGNGPATITNTGAGETVASGAGRSSAPAPAPRSNSGSQSEGGALPPPRVSNPSTADEPVRVLPAGDGGNGTSSGGAPVNPAGAPTRGYIRIGQGRVPASAPVRPSAAARSDENRAAAAARGGQSDAAINSLTAAIGQSDSNDLGYRYQQRASLFLERGEYSRAADDFQSAISAYNEQINRGEQTAQARAGLRASRAGLNMALSSARRG